MSSSTTNITGPMPSAPAARGRKHLGSACGSQVTSSRGTAVHHLDAVGLSAFHPLFRNVLTVVTPTVVRVYSSHADQTAPEVWHGCWGMGRRAMQPRVSLRARFPTPLAVASTMVGAVACTTLVVPVLACAAGPPPATRNYSGIVTGGTGAYSKASGRIAISLSLTTTGEAPTPHPEEGRPDPLYAVTITVRGDKCRQKTRHHTRCLVLFGILHGEAEEVRPPMPVSDQPQRLRIFSCSGELTDLRAVTATGMFEGTGFVPIGARSIVLNIATMHGTLLVKATGPPVPAFTPA